MTEHLTFEQLPIAVTTLTKEFKELKSKIENLTQQPTEDPKEWKDLNWLVDYDPAKRTKTTWYSKISRNEVPYHKKGKKVYFLKSEIDEWLKSGKRKTSEEIELEAEEYLSKK